MIRFFSSIVCPFSKFIGETPQPKVREKSFPVPIGRIANTTSSTLIPALEIN